MQVLLNKICRYISVVPDSRRTCEPILSLLFACFDISSMLADTENRLNFSSTAARVIEEVKWAYFLCHVYESNEYSLISILLMGFLAARDLGSAERHKCISGILMAQRCSIRIPNGLLTSIDEHRHFDVLRRCVHQLCDG